MNGIPYTSCAGFPFGQSGNDFCAGFVRCRFANDTEEAARDRWICLLGHPGIVQARQGFIQALEIAGITLVVERIAVHALLFAEVDESKNKRSEHRLSVLPA